MPKCKLSCGRVAVVGKWRKRYYKECGEKYLEKQRAFQEIARTLPMCDTRTAADCTGRLGGLRHGAGYTNCIQCQTERQKEEEKGSVENTKNDLFYRAETFEELKEWIDEYLL